MGNSSSSSGSDDHGNTAYCNTPEDFAAALKEAAGKPVFVDFTATWCPPCQKIGPRFVEFSKTHTDAVFIKIDVDQNKQSSQQYGVKAMPTFMAFKDGQKVDELVGADPKGLQALIEKYSTPPADRTKYCNSPEEFDAALKEAAGQTVFVDFTATWCPPCRAIGPKFVEFSKTHKDAIFIKIDVDLNKQSSQQYGVKAMPTFMAFKNGQKVDELVGADPTKLQALIEKNK